MRTRSTSLAPALVLAVTTMLAPTGAGASADAGSAAGAFAARQILVRFNGAKPQRRYELPRGIGVRAAAAALRRNPRVAWAVPNYIASASAKPDPNDPGKSNRPNGWRDDQWNFLGAPGGIHAMRAWENLIAAGRPGAQGVKVAVLDTGVSSAGSNPKFPISPDFAPGEIAPGYDFIKNDADPADQNGHGTHVAGTIAEQVDNGIGETGLAYGATVIPVRVLNRSGDGPASKVARGIYWAADHGAQVINMSLDFSGAVKRCGQIPDVCRAIDYADGKGALVVAAAGNIARRKVEFPARAPGALAVGASTEGGCLAAYSNYGSGLDIVAPGGGGSAALSRGGRCSRRRKGRDICQMGAAPPALTKFKIRCLQGTSQAAPHASATAALVIASKVLGGSPSPTALAARLESTARHLGRRRYFGAGLIDAGEATTK